MEYQLSYTMAVRNEAAAQTTAAHFGEGVMLQSKQLDGSTSSSLGEDDWNRRPRPDRPSVATTTAAATTVGGIYPPSPLTRSKSSPSLASVKRGCALRSSLPRQLPSCDDDKPPNRDKLRRRAVTATRSRSFVSPKIDQDENKSNNNNNNNDNGQKNRNRRREISWLMMHRQSPPKSVSSSSLSPTEGSSNAVMVMCEVHPQVRMRRNRCPRCAAGELKMARRSSLKSSSATTNSSGSGERPGNEKDGLPFCRQEESSANNTCTDWMEEIMNNAAADTSLAEDNDTETEEVSLDERWAETLRQISKRLANEKMQQPSMMDASGEEDEDQSFAKVFQADSCDKEQSAETYEEEIYPSSSSKPPRKKSLATLGELQRTIERATKSIGKFAPNVDDDQEDFHVPRSSMAWDLSPEHKKFAESKVLPPEQQATLRGYPRAQHDVYDAHYLSSSLDMLGATQIEGKEVVASSGSHGSSGSESSIMLSIASDPTIQSYNSLAEPPPRSDAMSPIFLTTSSESHESPNSVANTRDLSQGCNDGKEEEEEDQEIFENSLFVTAPMPATFSIRSVAKVESATTSNCLAPRHRSLSPDPQLAPDSFAPLLQSQPDNSRVEGLPTFESRHVEHIPNVVVEDPTKKDVAVPSPNNARVEEAMVKRVKEETTSASSGVKTGAPSAPNNSSHPSFFSALVRNSRSRSRSRPRKSGSRSKSRGRNVTGATEAARPRELNPNIDPEPLTEQNVDNEERSNDGFIGEGNKRETTRSASTRIKTAPASPSEQDYEVNCDSDRTRASHPPNKSHPSLVSALVHNSRSRSRPRSRKSSERSDAEAAVEARAGKLNSRDVGGSSDEEIWNKNGQTTEEQCQLPSKAPTVATREEEQTEVKSQTVYQPKDNFPENSSKCTTNTNPTSKPSTVNYYSPTQERGPITHPHYKLGDLGRDEDMIVFPKINSRHRQSRRRRRGTSHDNYSPSDSDDEEGGRLRKLLSEMEINFAIGQLRHLDAAFVRRSDGDWTYALVADGDDNQIRFVVNDRGATKSYPRSLWKSCVRRIRVLTPRQGDRFAINAKPSRKMRSIGSRSSQGRGNRRLVSPSPTRRKSNVLILLPTIMEGRKYA